MSNHSPIEFHSPIALLIKEFIQEKRACGYQYKKEESSILKRFDDFLCNVGLKQIALPKELVLQWIEKWPHEQNSTHQARVGLARQLAKKIVRSGYSAYVIPDRFGCLCSHHFSPYIFTRKEITQLIHAADQIKPHPMSPLRHMIIPEIFRLLYSCGFRLDEVLSLRVSDVNLKQGVITVRQAKFGKDRLVPLAFDMVERLRIYAERLEQESLEKRTDDAFFFPSPTQTAWSNSGIYSLFRRFLHQCGIQHGGRGKGPRVHDLRHTFAVHRLIQWHEEGVDLNAKQPLLVTYLGHQDFTGTQKYLHLTAELFPNLTARMNEQFGSAIPKWRSS